MEDWAKISGLVNEMNQKYLIIVIKIKNNNSRVCFFLDLLFWVSLFYHH